MGEGHQDVEKSSVRLLRDYPAALVADARIWQPRKLASTHRLFGREGADAFHFAG